MSQRPWQKMIEMHQGGQEKAAVWLTRGDPPEPEPVHEAVERILRENGIRVTEHGDDPYAGYQFEVSDGGLTYPLVCNYRGRNMVCGCSGALLRGDCAHRRAVKTWIRERRSPDPDPPAILGAHRPPRPFALWEGDEA